MKWRIIYGLLCTLIIISYSLPWSVIGDKTYNGWQMMLPCSFAFFIGLILSLVVLFVNFKPVTLTIIAGVLLILGVFGGLVGIGVSMVVIKGETGYGLGLSFLVSIVYTIVGSVVGNKMKKTDMVVETK